ncbi:MAG: cytochrome d ubiquinol oxidase subunit II [Prolixibacteraceae bacterium]|nr:cytochrome d ubiquinol oxidase subunit II [Prolixibacteraceae bacterium]
MDTIPGLDLQTWWFFVVGALFIVYAILDGFDFGAGAWHLFLDEEKERRIALNAIGPVWDGNEVWLVIGGGSLFAGFPVVYATLLSSMYIPFILFFVFIIFRAVSIEFRGKEKMTWWRKTWDISYSVSNIMLAFLLGVVLGNVLQGIPVGENFMYQGNGFFEFLNIYPLLVGVSTLFLFMTHGAIYLILKTEGGLYDKLTVFVNRAVLLFIVTFGITTLYTVIFIPRLLDEFISNPVLFSIPLAAFLSIANIPRLTGKKKYLSAFMFSSLTICLLLIIAGINFYQTLLLSTIDDKYSLSIYNAASSEKTLKIMLIMVAIGSPLVIAYTIFVYRTFRGKVKIEETSY